MPSVNGNTIEEHSAKKKARRGIRWIFPVALLFCALILGLGAAGAWYFFTPTEYSEEEAAAYVRTIYGDSWELREKIPLADEAGEGTRYLFAESISSDKSFSDSAFSDSAFSDRTFSDRTFSVFSLSVPVYEDGKPTGKYRKALFDNYFSTVIERNMDGLRDLEKETGSEAGIRLEIGREGDPEGIFGAEYLFSIYIDRKSDFPACADLVEKIDSLLAFTRADAQASDAGSSSAAYEKLRPVVPSVRIYMKPEKSGPAADAVSSAAVPYESGSIPRQDGLTDDWTAPGEREKYRLSTIPLSDTEKTRMKADQIFARMENDYVDASRAGAGSFYAASPDLREKYPAPVLTVVNIGGHDLTETTGGKGDFSYTLVYHRATDSYWMTGLDPCEDFDGNPFGSYARRGAFARLIQYLGGTYSCSDWKAEWKIGSSRWEAEEKTAATGASPYSHRSFTIFRNGNNEKLDQVPEIFQGTGALPSGRPFSVRDLIRMLDVRITINQQDMTAVIYRDFGNER